VRRVSAAGATAEPRPRLYVPTYPSGQDCHSLKEVVNAGGKRLSCGGPKLHTFLVSVPASSLWLARQPCGLGGVFDI
jgi:hypothetical protein